MNLCDILSIAKVYSQVFYGKVTLSDSELELAAKFLKELGNNRQDWSPQQREVYKALVDFVKENSKGQRR